MGNTQQSIKNIMALDTITLDTPVVNDGVYGKSSREFAVFKVYVDTINHDQSDIGQIVKYEIFREYNDFIINIGIGSSKIRKGIGEFANPKSHWFNSIIAFSRIDAPCLTKYTTTATGEGELSTSDGGTVYSGGWDHRPFGFTERSELHKQDLVLYCKAVFNYLVGYLYGVPIGDCLKCLTPLETGDEDVIVIARSARGVDGTFCGATFSEVEVVGIRSVTGYKHKRELDLNHATLTPTLQHILGKPYKSKKYAQPFFPITMRIRLLVRYEKNYDPVLERYYYSTYINIGSVRTDEPIVAPGTKQRGDGEKSNIAFYERFLEVLMEGIKITSLDFVNK